MPFNIHKVPFFKAVELFEAEQYQEAFDIFAECAQKGNLFAPFYLDHMLKHLGEKIKIQDKYGAFVKNLAETILHIPRDHRPESWCSASLHLITLKNNPKALKRLLPKLLVLYPHASNAAVFLFNHYHKTGNINLKIDILNNLSMKHANLFALFHLIQICDALRSETSVETVTSVKRNRLEWKTLQSFSESLLYAHGANIERLFSLYYNGPDSPKPSPFEKDLSRKLLWQINGAHLGNKSLQYMFSVKDPNSDQSDENRQCWQLMAAYNGEIQACIELGLRSFDEGNYSEARTFLEKGLAESVKTQATPHLRAKGFLYLASMHELGHGGFEKDDSAALKYYLEVEQLESYAGAGNVGVFYEHGRGGLEKNYQKAISQYLKAIEIIERRDSPFKAKTAVYHNNIARLYSKGGFGIEIDLKQTAEHCRLAYSSELWSLEHYGIMLLRGMAVAKDFKQGLELLIQAAEKGSSVAAYEILTVYLNRKINAPLEFGLTEEKIMAYLEIILKDPERHPTFQPHSCAGRFYLDFYSKQDHKKAFEHFMLGAQNKEISSLIRIGYFYEKGCEPLDIIADCTKAYEYYHEAAELGEPVALNNKAYLLLNGLGVPKDVTQAKQLFEAAIAGGSNSGAYGLGCMYYKGMGVAQDYKRAFEYFKMAEEDQDPDVLFSLGVSFHMGHGASIDLKQASQYYELAIQKGHSWAVHNFALLKLNMGFSEESLSMKTLEDVLQKLVPCVQKGYAASIFLHAMARLMLDPSMTKIVIEDLKIAISQKPYKASKLAIEYLSSLLKSNKPTTVFDITILLTKPDPLAFLKKLEDKETQETTSKPTDNEPNPLLLSKPPEVSPSKLRRLREDIAWFTDRDNIKSINFKEFKRLLGAIAVIEGMHLEILPSKGSNTRIHLSSETDDQTLSFSFHPTHRSGQGIGASFDPKRAKSLQGTMAKARARFT